MLVQDHERITSEYLVFADIWSSEAMAAAGRWALKHIIFISLLRSQSLLVCT